MHVVSRYTAAEAAATIDPRGRAIALSVVIAAGALLLIMPPVIGGDRHAESADGADCGLWRRVGIHTRTILALSLTTGGDALGLSAVSGRLAAGAGGLVWRAGLAGTAAGRGVRWGGSGCRLAHCGG